MSRAPYKYLDYYNFEDADLFFGREEETQRMVGEILSTRLLVLFSPSGSGKTSLINAGVRPQLENMGYQTIYTRLETEPIFSVCNAVAKTLEKPCDGNIQSLYEFLKAVTSRTEKPLVIFLDQFEEFFTVFREQHEKRKEFIDQLAKIKYDDQLPVFVVLSLREDYFVNLHEFRDAIPSIFQNNANLRLEPFTDEEARRAIVNPLKAKDIHTSIDDELVNELISDLKDSQLGIEPIKLQIVCHTLWERKPKGANQITLADYQACEGADAILSHHVQDVLNKIPKRQHDFMVRIFEALKTEDNTKRFRSFGELQLELKIKKPERLAKMLDKFSDLRLLRFEEKERNKWYEFKHDYLVGEITKWMQRRKEQISKDRLFYAVAPGIFITIILLIWALKNFSLFEARFADQNYEEQQQEIVIKRKFNPFDFQITTGILYNELINIEVRNVIKNGFMVSFGKKNDWKSLIGFLNQDEIKKSYYCIAVYGSDIDKLISGLKNDSWSVRSQAAKALGKFDHIPRKAIKVLVKTLNDKEKDVHSEAVLSLEKLGKTDEYVIEALNAALKDSSANIRYQSAIVLASLDKVNQDVIEELKHAITGYSEYARFRAAEALGRLGTADLQVTNVLMVALKDNDSNVRSQAAKALGKFDRIPQRAIKVLANTLNDKEKDVHSEAVLSLEKLGKTDKYVVEVLDAALKDSSANMRYHSAIVLASLDKVNQDVIEELKHAITGYSEYARFRAVEALGRLGIADMRVTDVLMAAFKEKDSNVLFRAAAVLENVSKADDPEIVSLVAALKDQGWDTRSQVAAVLGNLGNADIRVIDALVAALKNQSSSVRAHAAAALGNLRKADDRVIDMLLATLKDQVSYVRSKSADALGNIYKFESKKKLFEYLRDELSGYRTAGAQALARQDSITDYILEKVNRLKDKDKRPWVRLGAWEAYELIQQRLADEKAANQFIHKADSLFQINKFLAAEDQYQSAYDQLKKIIRIDSLKIASTKFQQARCTVRMKRLIHTLDHLEIAFQYNKAWRDTLRAEREQKGSEWEFMKDNWYLKEVLLGTKFQNSKHQITNLK